MKYRAGFVSNSSSSSFIVAVKGDGKLDVDTLVGLFQVPQNSPLHKIAIDMAQVIIDRSHLYDEKEIKYQFGYESLEEALREGNRHARLISDGFTVYSGYASDEDGGIEAMLCNTKINFESEDVVMYCEGGY